MIEIGMDENQIIDKKTVTIGQDARGRFVKGNKLSGKKRGPNKITKTVREVITGHFLLQDTTKVLDGLQENNPEIYYNLLEKAGLPKLVEVCNHPGEAFKVEALNLEKQILDIAAENKIK